MTLITSVRILNSNTMLLLGDGMSQQLSLGTADDSSSYKMVDDACMTMLFRISQ